MNTTGPHHLHAALLENVGKLKIHDDVITPEGVHNAEQWYARASSVDRSKFERVIDGIRTCAQQPSTPPRTQLASLDRATPPPAIRSRPRSPAKSSPFTIRDDPELVRKTFNSSQFQFWVPDPKWRAEEKQRIKECGERLRSSTRGPHTCSEEDDAVWKKRFETSYNSSFSNGDNGPRPPEMKKTLFNTSVDDPINEVLLAENYAAPLIRETHHNAMSRFIRDQGEESRQAFSEVFNKINTFQRSTEAREKYVQRKQQPPSPVHQRVGSSSIDTSTATIDDIIRINKRAEARLLATLPRQNRSAPHTPTPGLDSTTLREGENRRHLKSEVPWATLHDSGDLSQDLKQTHYRSTFGAPRMNSSQASVPADKLHGQISAATGRVLPDYRHQPVELTSPYPRK
eukprot:TRINITY_DN4382_c0_g1_i4.p2 TRINITY_DN4382_c0_g1~~TRINITY_DN4382_c0_g1_i4.p2  ORF type:complete len:400 (+),score=61.95 TRINITY_DN4382_c0_g1_i4:2384-3583(+)